MDKDGRLYYSNVVMLKSRATAITMSSVYPNPASSILNFVITSPTSEKLAIVVTDLTGKLIFQKSIEVKMGDNINQVQVNSLAPGTYVIKAVCNNGCETAVHRFVKL